MSIGRIIVIAAMLCLGWLQVPCGAEKIVLRLKPGEVRQEIDGFGHWRWKNLKGRTQGSKAENEADLTDLRRLQAATLSPMK